jgi:hypothetical protein
LILPGTKLFYEQSLLSIFLTQKPHVLTRSYLTYVAIESYI